LIFALYQLPAGWPGYHKYRAPNREELRASIGYGVLNTTAAGPGELDKVAVAHLLSPAQAGLYSAATRVVGAATLPVLALMFSIMPRLFRSAVAVDANTPALHRLILLVCLGYATILCGGFWLFAGWLEVLFGLHYAGIGQVLRWLIPAIPALVLRMAAGNILMTAGKTWVRASFELVGILVLLLCAATLAPRFGVAGMAIAFSCAEWAMALISVVMVLRTHKRLN
jgi:O-antigen/teichoic acid export membrane protein